MLKSVSTGNYLPRPGLQSAKPHAKRVRKTGEIHFYENFYGILNSSRAGNEGDADTIERG
ncbi:hypothetical protein QUB47_03660 [Microcoleus sp. AT9_B5]